MGCCDLTLFTVPKPFVGDYARIQTNAIRSWKALGADVILLGDDAGVSIAARRLGVRWGGRLTRNDYGTPLLSDAFMFGEMHARTELVAYVNTDIILFDDFLLALDTCDRAFPHFLMSGQRFDVDVTDDLRFDSLDGVPMLYRSLMERSTPLGPHGMDYFAYRKGDLGNMPPFAIGRFRFDNWILWRALNLGLELIDATEVVFDAHQNHPPMPRVEGDAELHANDALVGTHGGQLCRLTDATFKLNAEYQFVAP